MKKRDIGSLHGCQNKILSAAMEQLLINCNFIKYYPYDDDKLVCLFLHLKITELNSENHKF